MESLRRAVVRMQLYKIPMRWRGSTPLNLHTQWHLPKEDIHPQQMVIRSNQGILLLKLRGILKAQATLVLAILRAFLRAPATLPRQPMPLSLVTLLQDTQQPLEDPEYQVRIIRMLNNRVTMPLKAKYTGSRAHIQAALRLETLDKQLDILLTSHRLQMFQCVGLQ